MIPKYLTFGVIMAALFAFFLWVVWGKGCNTSQNKVVEKKEAAIIKNVSVSDAPYKKANDSLVMVIHRISHSRDSLTAVNQELNTALNFSKSRATALVVRHDALQVIRADPVKRMDNCDSMAREMTVLSNTVTRAQENTRQLMDSTASEIAARDSLVAAKDRQYQFVRDALSQVHDLFDEQSKDLARTKTLAQTKGSLLRIFGLAILALLAKIFLIK